MRSIPRHYFALSLLPLVLGASACTKTAEAAPVITVYKTPICGCCKNWVEHLRKNGFQVKTIDRVDLTPVKRQQGVPEPLSSCHTAIVDDYTIEGHVPAEVIRKLLTERPTVVGLAVPGMPMGAPGMEGPTSQPYEVYTFDQSGPKSIYAAR